MKSIALPKTIRSRWIEFLLLFVASSGIIYAIYLLPVGIDWMQIREGSLAMLVGKSPYVGVLFFPPWVYVLLTPLAILPAKLGAAVLSFLNLVVFGSVAIRLGRSPV